MICYKYFDTLPKDYVILGLGYTFINPDIFADASLIAQQQSGGKWYQPQGKRQYYTGSVRSWLYACPKDSPIALANADAIARHNIIVETDNIRESTTTFIML